MDSSQQAPLDHVDTSAYLPVAMRRGARACAVRQQPQAQETGMADSSSSDGGESSADDSDGDENSNSSGEDEERAQRHGSAAAAAAGGGGARGGRSRRAPSAAGGAADNSTQPTALHTPYSHLVVGRQGFILSSLRPTKQLFTDIPFHNNSATPVQLSVTVHPDDWNVQEYVLSQQQPGVVNGGGQQQQQSAGQQTAPVAAAAAASSSTTFGPYSATFKLNTASRQLRLTDLQHSGELQSYCSHTAPHHVVLQERVPVTAGNNSLSPPHLKLHIKPGKPDANSSKSAKAISPAGAGVGLQIFPGSVSEVAEAGRVTLYIQNGKPQKLWIIIPRALACSQLPQLAGDGASAPQDVQVKVVEQDSAGGQRTQKEWQLKLYKNKNKVFVQAPPSHALSAYVGRSISRMSLTPDKQLTMTYAAQQTQAAAGTSGAPAGAAAAAASGGTQLPPPGATTSMGAAATAQAAAAGGGDGPENAAAALTAVFAAQPAHAAGAVNRVRSSSNNTADGTARDLSTAQYSEQAIRSAVAPAGGGGVQPAGLLLPPPAAAAAPSAGQHSRDPRRRVNTSINNSGHQQQPTGVVTPQPAAAGVTPSLPGTAQLPAAVGDRRVLPTNTVQLPHKRAASSTQTVVLEQQQQDGGTGVDGAAKAEEGADGAVAAAAARGGRTDVAAGSSRKKPKLASGQQQQRGSRRSSSTVAVDNTTPAATSAMDVDSRVQQAGAITAAGGGGGDRSAVVDVAGSQPAGTNAAVSTPPASVLQPAAFAVPRTPQAAAADATNQHLLTTTPVTPAAAAPAAAAPPPPAAISLIKQEPAVDVMDLTGADSDAEGGGGGEEAEVQQQQQQQQETAAAARGGTAAAGEGQPAPAAGRVVQQNATNAAPTGLVAPPAANTDDDAAAAADTQRLPHSLRLDDATTQAEIEQQLLRLMKQGLRQLTSREQYGALMYQLEVLFEPLQDGASSSGGGTSTRLAQLQRRYDYLQGAVDRGQLPDVLRNLNALLGV